jgi:poly-gamma-glutamate biosynthesis protein PgsC/CapC
MISELFLTGLIVGFLFYEFTGVSPGGIIAPAYFAMFIFDPGKMLNTLLLAVIVLLILSGMARIFLLYGRRKLLVAVLLSFVIKILMDQLWFELSVFQFDLQSIGYIIPGLVANEMDRQKVLPTLLALGIVTLMIYLIVQLF